MQQWRLPLRDVVERSETESRRGRADELPSHYYMKKIYHQLTPEQRYKLESYLEAGKTQTEISVLLGFHKSTIWIFRSTLPPLQKIIPLFRSMLTPPADVFPCLADILLTAKKNRLWLEKHQV